MTFVDASALVALLAGESQADLIRHKLRSARQLFVSPIMTWETTIALTRSHAVPLDEAEIIVLRFVEKSRARVIAIDASIGRIAIEASRRYGKGRHPASLNMGDCFSYACAKAHRLGLLYVGSDFEKTDLA